VPHPELGSGGRGLGCGRCAPSLRVHRMDNRWRVSTHNNKARQALIHPPRLSFSTTAPPSCRRLDHRWRHTTRRRRGLRPDRPLHIARARPRAHQLDIVTEPIARVLTP